MFFKKNKKKKKKQFLDNSVPLITNRASFEYVEAYKSICTNIEFISGKKGYKSFVITSAEPGDGKTSVSANVAIALAQNNHKVILLDCDLRKGSLSELMNIPRGRTGLADHLGKGAPIDSIIIEKKDEYNLKVIPSGMIPQNPSGLLGTSKMEELLNTLYTAFDYIIIDSPPVSIITDAAVLSRSTDGVLLVARQEHTDKQLLHVAKQHLNSVNANIVGVILNDFGYSDKTYGKDYGYS